MHGIERFLQNFDKDFELLSGRSGVQVTSGTPRKSAVPNALNLHLEQPILALWEISQLFL